MDKTIVREYDVMGFGGAMDAMLESRKKHWYQHVGRWFGNKWYRIQLKWADFRWRIKNHITFDKMLKEWYPWDWECQVELFAFGLEQLVNCIDNGHEVEVSRTKKVAAIRELIQLLRTKPDEGLYEKYLEPLDKVVKEHVTEYADGSFGINTATEEGRKLRSEAIAAFDKEEKENRDKQLERIFYLIKGQEHKALLDKVNQIVGEKREDETPQDYSERYQEYYDTLYDGSGIEGWWE